MPLDPNIILSGQPAKFNDPFAVLQAYRNQAQENEYRQQQMRSQQALEEERRRKTEEERQQQQREAQTATILSDAYRQSFDPQTKRVNKDKLSSILTEAGFGQAVPGLLKGLDESDTAAMNARTAKAAADKAALDYSKTMAGHIIAADFAPPVIDWALTHAETEGYDVAPFRQLLQEPDKFKAFVTHLVEGPKKEQPLMNVASGTDVLDPATRQIVYSNKAEQKPPVPGSKEDVLARFARERGKKIEDLTTAELGQAERAANPIAAPKDDRIVQVMRPNGVPIWTKESDAVGQPAAQAPRAVTGLERKVFAFYKRGKEALDTITEPDKQGLSLEDRMAALNIADQARMGYEGFGSNFLKSPDMQRYREAQRSFTEARLRNESGAAIPPYEYTNDEKTYFKVAGDSPEVVAQKRRLRDGVLQGLGFSAGKAYDEFYGEPFQTPRTSAQQAAPKADQAPQQKPIPGIPGGIAELRNGRWIRIK